MFIHDLVKIRYSSAGYLANLPYHLISDAEMFEAFMPQVFHPDIFTPSFPDIPSAYEAKAQELFRQKPWLISGGFFAVYYPASVVASDIKRIYRRLKEDIELRIKYYLESPETNPLPDWVYAYMLGNVISVNSDKQDIHDLISALGVDNVDDDYLPECTKACYLESEAWLRNTGQLNLQYSSDPESVFSFDLRRPTPFGEPHVVKSLRLKQAAPT